MLLSEYSMTLDFIRLELPLSLGLDLLEARACRLAPDRVVSHVERQIISARQQVRAWYQARYTIIPTPPRAARNPA